MDAAKTKNIVFIAKSLDGFIAGKNGELDWLHATPNPDNEDMGYHQLMDEIDAILMGRTTFETVCGFGGAWPYSKHVFVLSHSLQAIPAALNQQVTLLSGDPVDILNKIHEKGYFTLYIDGGRTVQSFLQADLIDELRITTIPILLGGGKIYSNMDLENYRTPWRLSISNPSYISVKSYRTTIKGKHISAGEKAIQLSGTIQSGEIFPQINADKHADLRRFISGISGKKGIALCF
ncbi:MAG: dihydrofolate reductase family protein [Saprospiraceae bacterium]